MKKIFQPTKCLSREELEHYVKGDVSEELRYTIENHLLDCPLCSEAMEGYQLMGNESDHIFEEMFQDIDSKLSVKTETVTPVSKVPWNRIAAGILFLFSIGAAYWYYQSRNEANNYLTYFENQDATLATRSIEELSADLKTGVSLYANENYQGSLSFFEDYLKSNSESTTAAYYAGMSALRVGENSTAFDFLSVVRMNDDRLYEEATWQIAGIHLKRGHTDKAKVLLEDLVKVENGYFVEQAKKLLEEL